MFKSNYHHRRVLVTGHTGFKGSWLCHWLLELGAEVHGIALDPQPHDRLYHELELTDRIASDTRADIRDLNQLLPVLDRTQPEILIHLAAQTLVRRSYEAPVETFSTNIMGTVNVLEALRLRNQPCAVVIVTTDKCYENREWVHAYREEDALGGHDPYSASKGAAEIVTASFRRSYFEKHHEIRVATARAGNVIGGGDWAIDRIVPDIFRALEAKQPIPVRNKHATRPWQHVLEPLSGYLWLADCLYRNQSPDGGPPQSLCSAFNFGPGLSSNRTVAEVVESILAHTGGTWIDRSDPTAPHEAGRLNLSTDKAFHQLRWSPRWNFETTIEKTATWYQSELPPIERTTQQIKEYEAATQT